MDGCRPWWDVCGDGFVRDGRLSGVGDTGWGSRSLGDVQQHRACDAGDGGRGFHARGAVPDDAERAVPDAGLPGGTGRDELAEVRYLFQRLAALCLCGGDGERGVVDAVQRRDPGQCGAVCAGCAVGRCLDDAVFGGRPDLGDGGQLHPGAVGVRGRGVRGQHRECDGLYRAGGLLRGWLGPDP